MNTTVQEKLKKGFKLAAKLAWWCFLVALAVLLVNIIGAKMRGRVPSVFGYSVLNIVSGSMGEDIPSGSYILVKRVDPEQVKQDDIISFYSTDPLIYGLPNTHRVISEPTISEDGKIFFETKGDANPVPDSVMADGDMLIGVFVRRMYSLESLTGLLSGRGLFAVIIAAQIAIVVMMSVGIYKKQTAKDTDDDAPQESEEK